MFSKVTVSINNLLSALYLKYTVTSNLTVKHIDSGVSKTRVKDK